jgi:beta-glucosidase
MFKIVTFNLEQDHKRWMERRKLIGDELATINPDIISFNEVCVPLQSAKILRDAITSTTGISYNLVQQTKVNGLSEVEGEALLTRYPVIETGNLDYQTRDMVALVARVLIDATPVDVYVTHLFKSRGDDSLRLFQVEQLLAWVNSRPDTAASIICGDFNATVDMPSAARMTSRFRPTQTSTPTAFTPLSDKDGTISHPYWPRMDRCIDYIWVSEAVDVVASGVCLNRPASDDPTLWPSDHAGVWADLSVSATT